MGSLYLTWLADELRAAGVKVVEMDGWKTRGRGSGGYSTPPLCVMWHHTASPPSWHGQKDADYCTYQDSNSPLANIIVGGDTAWIAAAGATNTNGKGVSLSFSRGTVPADSMNSYAVGIEIGNDGVGEPWSQATIDTMFKISNAINKRLGNQPTDVSSHANYSVGRKIDPATAAAVQGPWKPRSINSSGTWNVDDLKAECKRRAQGSGPTPPAKGGLMFKMFVVLGNTYGGYFDEHGIAAQVTWLSPNRAAACTAAGAPHIGELSPADMSNCDLLGPCPENTPRTTFANVIP